MNIENPNLSTRTKRRTRVLMTATLMTPTGAQKVMIRDISRSGASIVVPEPIPSACDAIFKRGSLFAAARVAWSNDREAGLTFYRELTAEEVEDSLHPALLRAS